jgi:hypothetical protein
MSSPIDFSKSSIRLPISSILLMMDDDIVLNRPCICSNRFCTNSVKSAALSGTVSALKSNRWSAIVFTRFFCLGKDSSARFRRGAKSGPAPFFELCQKVEWQGCNIFQKYDGLSTRRTRTGHLIWTHKRGQIVA